MVQTVLLSTAVLLCISAVVLLAWNTYIFGFPGILLIQSSEEPPTELVVDSDDLVGKLEAGPLAQTRYIVHVSEAKTSINVRLYRRSPFTNSHSRQLLCLSDGQTFPACVPSARSDVCGNVNNAKLFAEGAEYREDHPLYPPTVHVAYNELFSGERNGDSNSSGSGSSSSSSSSEQEPSVNALYNIVVNDVPENTTFRVVVASTGEGYNYEIGCCTDGCKSKCLLDCIGHGSCRQKIPVCDCDPGFSGIGCVHGCEDTSSASQWRRWWATLFDIIGYGALGAALLIFVILTALFTYQWIRYGRCCAWGICCCCCSRRKRLRNMYAKFNASSRAPGVIHYRSVSSRSTMVYRAPSDIVPSAVNDAEGIPLPSNADGHSPDDTSPPVAQSPSAFTRVYLKERSA